MPFKLADKVGIRTDGDKLVMNKFRLESGIYFLTTGATRSWTSLPRRANKLIPGTC